MKPKQLDLILNRDPTPSEWRTTAETARIDPNYTPQQREQRARYYEQQAKIAEQWLEKWRKS